MRALWKAHGDSDLFRLVSYDAGACSLENAALVRELGLHYLFGLTGAQPTLLDEAKRQRADTSRQRPWRSLMRDVYTALVAATAADLAGMRRHLIPPVPD